MSTSDGCAASPKRPQEYSVDVRAFASLQHRCSATSTRTHRTVKAFLPLPGRAGVLTEDSIASEESAGEHGNPREHHVSLLRACWTNDPRPSFYSPRGFNSRRSPTLGHSRCVENYQCEAKKRQQRCCDPGRGDHYPHWDRLYHKEHRAEYYQKCDWSCQFSHLRLPPLRSLPLQ